MIVLVNISNIPIQIYSVKFQIFRPQLDVRVEAIEIFHSDYVHSLVDTEETFALNPIQNLCFVQLRIATSVEMMKKLFLVCGIIKGFRKVFTKRNRSAVYK